MKIRLVNNVFIGDQEYLAGTILDAIKNPITDQAIVFTNNGNYWALADYQYEYWSDVPVENIEVNNDTTDGLAKLIGQKMESITINLKV